MTYFGFLARFLLPPILLLLLLAYWDWRRGLRLPAQLQGWPATWVLLAHVVVAVVYTTPWDNYLVATGVWWYDPKLVTGIVIGWVPIEEYTFFVLQTILSSLWLHFVAKRTPGNADIPVGKLQPTGMSAFPGVRVLCFLFTALAWLGSAYLLLIDWQPGTYLTLTLVWALLPVMVQMAFGADILWRNRWVIVGSLFPITLYLCLVDALAIDSGTWTIAPGQSTGVMFGPLPLEEAVFFLITNLLIVLGTILVLDQASQPRAQQLAQKIKYD